MQMQNTSDTGLWDKRQTADRLNVSQRTIDNRIKAGTIPYLKIGKLIRFLPSDIERFVESHRIVVG